MSNVPVRSLGAVKEHAATRSDEFVGAEKIKSVVYMELAVRTPKNATAKEVYAHLTPAMRSTIKETSFPATWSLVLKVERAFAKAKADGRYDRYSDAVAFVSDKGSIIKAERALFPAKAESKAPADPVVGGESKAESSSKGKVVEGTVEVSKADVTFAEVCQTIREWSVSDLTALVSFAQDTIAKRTAQATPVAA